ncbi:flagellar basal-body rod protein FlgG [Cohaesibacter celericrescens]|uniref:Flagellar basal-body rod protein FlgG n=1 Tax=Cohaesibacter celericrescens TaxID=2067669 RepID=A0A2N5XWF3_9HYPH|nr:flagellar basal-body rod protein FlgG [Cohaesibacter celericrescens]PLW78843.1 flagellar basal-body rod protein FlgG [Cohaesibacter celericrescens]
MRALYIASTGMLAQERNVEVTSNNIANMRTTGYKKQRAEFQDLLYQDLRRTGSSTSASGTTVPVGVQIGSGVRLAATARVMSQGSVESTSKELDVAIRGEGFFQISLPDGRTGYTRDGSFELDSTGQLVTVDGYTVQPGITFPDDTRDITISTDGEVQVTTGNSTTTQTLGQLTLARFVNKAGLDAIGDNLYLETGASGTPQVATPADDGYGTLLQSYLELANVNSVSEISDLIAAQRAYEMNSRVISAADEMLSSTTNLR